MAGHSGQFCSFFVIDLIFEIPRDHMLPRVKNNNNNIIIIIIIIINNGYIPGSSGLAVMSERHGGHCVVVHHKGSFCLFVADT